MVSHVRGTYLCRKNAVVAADLYLQNELALIVGTVGCE
jgi:hypothetical protein